jgi:hypothetical protein
MRRNCSYSSPELIVNGDMNRSVSECYIVRTVSRDLAATPRGNATVTSLAHREVARRICPAGSLLRVTSAGRPSLANAGVSYDSCRPATGIPAVVCLHVRQPCGGGSLPRWTTRRAVSSPVLRSYATAFLGTLRQPVAFPDEDRLDQSTMSTALVHSRR